MNNQNTHIGASYEEFVEEWVVATGAVLIRGRNVRHESGIELDIDAEIKDTGQRLGIECKASEPDANSPGMNRSDNRWKVQGYIHQLERWKAANPTADIRYLLITSHMPKPGTEQRRALDMEELLGTVHVIELPWTGRPDIKATP